MTSMIWSGSMCNVGGKLENYPWKLSFRGEKTVKRKKSSLEGSFEFTNTKFAKKMFTMRLIQRIRRYSLIWKFICVWLLLSNRDNGRRETERERERERKNEEEKQDSYATLIAHRRRALFLEIVKMNPLALLHTLY